MRILIVEDERLAAERLKTLLHNYDPGIVVAACLDSVGETVKYLKEHAHPDLMLLDIHLADGHSFEIFKQVQYIQPVIFTTAYDQYALDAFRFFSVDYIVKPVNSEALATALNKYRSFSATFSSPDINQLLPDLLKKQYKTRFLGKVGQRISFVDTATVSFFEADNKIVYLVDMNGNRFIIDHTMEALEELLNPAEFFRPNRSFIVHIASIRHVKPYYNNRLKLDMTGMPPDTEIVISRDKVGEFKTWAEGVS